MYNELPIHDKKEIVLTAKEIKEILNIEYSKTIGIILKNLEEQIINDKVKNKKTELKKYIIEHKSEWLK